MTPESWREDILSFWFQELKAKDWFTPSSELDERIRKRFGPLIIALAANLRDANTYGQ